MTIYKHIDKNRLEILYRENLTLIQIGKIFRVGPRTVSRAIDFYQIPKRKKTGAGDHAVELRKTREMAELYQNGMTLESVGKRFGLTRQGVRHRFRQAGIERRSAAKYKNIDKNRLEKFYLRDQLPVGKIASLFKVADSVIYRALKFHHITKRDSIVKGGYIIKILKNLTIGEKKQIKLRSTVYSGIYSTAKRLGIKISVKTRGDRLYDITRIG